MIIGQTLLTDTDGSSKTYYSPWFGSGGDGAEFTIDILAKTTNCDITVYVETKNTEGDNSVSAGNVVAVNNSGSIGAAAPTVTPTAWLSGRDVAGGALNSSLSGLLELVRFRFVVGTGESSLEWIHFRMLSPAWISDGS